MLEETFIYDITVWLNSSRKLLFGVFDGFDRKNWADVILVQFLRPYRIITRLIHFFKCVEMGEMSRSRSSISLVKSERTTCIESVIHTCHCGRH